MAIHSHLEATITCVGRAAPFGLSSLGSLARSSVMRLLHILGFFSVLNLASAPVLAYERDGSPHKLSSEQKQELFAGRRAWEIKSHDRRIAILQEAQRCIKAVADRSAYKACEKAEGEARRALRKEARATLNATRIKLGLDPINGSDRYAKKTNKDKMR